MTSINERRGIHYMKLVASDYDKTFHRHDQQDLETNMNAVAKWRNKGNIFAISTGRDVASMLNEKRMRNIEYDYIVSLNGSFVVDIDNNILFKQPLENTLARDLVAMLREKMGDEINISNGFDGFNMTHKSASLTNAVSKEIFDRNSTIYTKTMQAALDDDVFLIGCLNDNFEQAEQLKKEILLKYENQVEVFLNLNYINIVPKGISKATGVGVLIEHIGIDEQFVSVIGDDLNDIPMIERYKGYTVNNARDDVKATSVKSYDSVAELIEDVY